MNEVIFKQIAYQSALYENHIENKLTIYNFQLIRRTSFVIISLVCNKKVRLRRAFTVRKVIHSTKFLCRVGKKVEVVIRTKWLIRTGAEFGLYVVWGD